MAAHHRDWLERMSAPLVAWLIDNGSVADNCGVLDITNYGKSHFHEQIMVGIRSIQGHRPHPVPEMTHGG
jgi:hypothetical protein